MMYALYNVDVRDGENGQPAKGFCFITLKNHVSAEIFLKIFRFLKKTFPVILITASFCCYREH